MNYFLQYDTGIVVGLLNLLIDLFLLNLVIWRASKVMRCCVWWWPRFFPSTDPLKKHFIFQNSILIRLMVSKNGANENAFVNPSKFKMLMGDNGCKGANCCLCKQTSHDFTKQDFTFFLSVLSCPSHVMFKWIIPFGFSDFT